MTIMMMINNIFSLFKVELELTTVDTQKMLESSVLVQICHSNVHLLVALAFSLEKAKDAKGAN